MARQARHCGSNVDPPDHTIEHGGTELSVVLPTKDFRSLLGTTHKGILWRCREWKVSLQSSLYTRWHSAPSLSSCIWLAHQKELSDTSH
jgi:hypothetical protein